MTSGDFDAELTLEFGTFPGDDIGRHGGIMFCASVPTGRLDPAMDGYTIDWIDRGLDYGLRLVRWDNGLNTELVNGTSDLPGPPRLWQLAVEGESIRSYADGTLVFEVSDATYREGHSGLWAFNNGTQVLVDDVRVGRNFRDSFTGRPLSLPGQ